MMIYVFWQLDLNQPILDKEITPKDCVIGTHTPV